MYLVFIDIAMIQLDEKRKAGESIESLSLSSAEQKQFAMELDVIKRNLEAEGSQVKCVFRFSWF